jgi:hypothetical protein
MEKYKEEDLNWVIKEMIKSLIMYKILMKQCLKEIQIFQEFCEKCSLNYIVLFKIIIIDGNF